jgi:serine phosphatase RsbU (regulator of sigma subunit)
MTAAAAAAAATSNSPMRLTETSGDPAVAVERPADAAASGTVARISPLESPLDAMQRELEHVREELEALRRRDDTMRFYMHRLDEELRLAARVQQDFLPKSLPKVGDVRFQILFRPAGHVSGDLYDVMRLDEAHVGFYMADAVGHGMPAALLTMFLKQALTTKDIYPGGYRLLAPNETMLKLNNALIGQNLSQATFATALYGHINTKTLELTFARGGHPNPVLVTRNGEMKTLEAGGSLLGIFPEEQFEQATVQLQPGDRFFIYSDGVELAFTDEVTLDAQRWVAELHERRTLPTDQILGEFTEYLDRADGNQNKKRDDLTIIVVEVMKSA